MENKLIGLDCWVDYANFLVRKNREPNNLDYFARKDKSWNSRLKFTGMSIIATAFLLKSLDLLIGARKVSNYPRLSTYDNGSVIISRNDYIKYYLVVIYE